MHQIIDMIKEFMWQIGYTEIFLMMVLESSFFPFPSEVAMIPAWILSSTGKLNFWLALLAWTFWALVWATINYLLGYYLWWTIIKSLISKYGKYFFIKEEHYTRTEKYFNQHWVVTTFLARFITVIRQLISLPAWVFKMNFAKFFFYTGLGAWLWNLALVVIGYIAWENSELIAKHSKALLIGWIILIIILGSAYYYYQKHKSNKKKSWK